jgi:hypothetical protein
MNALITGIYPQPNFPHEDLVESNAELLSLLLSNNQILQDSHSRSEDAEGLYKILHPRLKNNVANILAEPHQLNALSEGLVAYEAIAAMVVKQIDVNNTILLAAKYGPSVSYANPDSLQEILGASYRVFCSNMQNTKEVIQQVTSRKYQEMGEYAIRGAALMYAIETDLLAA